MTKQKLLVRVSLLSLIVLELWMFSGSFQKYFNLDSAFYVINAPHSRDELRQVFAAPDPGKQYRPLTLAFMALLVPIFKLNPRPYHWIPLVFHLANTLLVYGLARRMLKGTVAVFAATVFWGLHSVAGWVTYDTTCVPDFIFAFLLFVSFTFAVDGNLNRSVIRKGASLVFFVLALLTKEAAVTAPLAVLICLVLSDLRDGENAPETGDLWRSLRKAAPLTSVFLGIAAAYAGFLVSWLRAGLIYTQGSGAAYNISPWSNLLAKAKYFFWALNLPDYLYIPDGARVRLLVFGLMGILLLCLVAEIFRRRGRMEPSGWAGLLWLVGMNLPALMLSNRVAKWYLYVPLLGLSFTLGTLAQSLRDRLTGWKSSVAVSAVLVLFTIPTLFSSVAQNRSYLSFSDASYASDILQSFYRDLQRAYPERPPRATVLLLPSFEPTVVSVLSAPPVNGGELVELQYPGCKARMLFAHKGDRLSAEELRDPNLRVFQTLYDRFYDVSRYYRQEGRMTLYVLPTSEGIAPPLLKKEPAGGRTLYGSHVNMLIADEGVCLPADYRSREDLWILQYVEGHFYDVTRLFKGKGTGKVIVLPTLDAKIPPLHALRDDPYNLDMLADGPVQLPTADKLSSMTDEELRKPGTRIMQYIYGHYYDVTDYYRGRRRDPSRRIVTSIDDSQSAVSRDEYYPSYTRFGTPTGAPVFFVTPQRDIVTQIGGSTVTFPMGRIPPGASLRFDVSWMFDKGDGGWAEMRLRASGYDTILFRQYMHPNATGSGFEWQEVVVDLRRFQGQQADLVLRCYNDRGKNTVADWLNWRDIALEEYPATQTLYGP